jgi:hypothetical protein
MSMQDAGNDLESLVRRLPRELAPPAELWPRIAARLEPREAAPLDLLARRLPTDVDPPPEVWAGVAAGIGAAPARRRAVGYLAAAALLVAGVAALLAIATREPPPDDAGGARTVAAEPERSPPSTLDAAWMLGAAEVPEDVIAAMRTDYALVQAERVAIEQAIDSAPNDARLRELWAHAYEAELELNDIFGRTIMTYQRGSGI